MKDHTGGSQHSSGTSFWRAIFILPYQKWKAWRLKAKTRRLLRGMSDENLKDIGLRREDID